MEWFQPPPAPVFRLDTGELRRMNLAARRAPELSDFLGWYHELSELDQRALTCHLLRFGSEYNDGSRWDDVVAAAGLPTAGPLVRHLESCRPPGASFMWGFRDADLFPWLKALASDQREGVFRFAACFFGLNERERYEICKANGACSHWWHQA